MELDYNLNFGGKGQLKEIGYPQEEGDITTLSFWNSCLTKAFSSQTPTNIDNILSIKKATYLEWKQSKTEVSSVYLINESEKEKLIITESGLYNVNITISVAEIAFGESFDNVIPFELHLLNSNELKILEKSYVSSSSTVCISSSFEVDIQNPSENYCLQIFNPSYDCEIYEIFWSLIKISELSFSKIENK